MNLLSLLSDLVRRDADATVAIDADPRQPVTVSRGELWRRTLQLRADLADAGVGRGDCVGVWLPNWSDALAWQFAAASLGAHVIGVNTRYNVAEVTHVLDRARPKVMAVAHEFHGLDLISRLREAVDRAAAPAPAVAVVAGPHGSTPDDPAEYDVGAGAWVPSPTGQPPKPAAQLPSSAAQLPEPGDGGGDKLAVAFTTSGSTGMPKLAAHKESAVVAHAFADARGIGIRESDVVLCVLPLSGVFGFNTAMAALAGGAACLLEPVFDEDAVVGDMERYGVTQLVGGDDMVSRVEQAWRRERRDLSTWRWLGVADFLGRSKELAVWARDEFGTLTSGVYGSSEVFALTMFWPHDEPEPRRWSGGGRLVSPGMEARTVDPLTEQVLPASEQGELQLRGPTVVDAYLGDPSAAARAFTPDGWFRTGDLAVIAPDGGVEYVCRMGDVLRLRGFLVDPAEIEFRLTGHEAVQTAKVVGVRGATGETVAVGFVVPVEGRSPGEQELRAWCAETLARFKVPAAIYVIDKMPTTSGTNGSKIRAVTLREWAQQRLFA